MDELYIVARKVLLDALEALGPHLNAVVLVGAQAIYMRVGDADVAVAPYTTDGDLAIEPAVLGRMPPVEKAMMAAGFLPKSTESVGVWVTYRATSFSPSTEVSIDLLVPESVSPGKGRRAARLPGHDVRAARIVRGLEGALVDADTMPLRSLERSDDRMFEMRVAGPAALLVAKVHKIAERRDSNRQSDKDALDVFRLLRGTESSDLARRLQRLLADGRSDEATRAALLHFRRQFGDRSAEGVRMILRAVGPLMDKEEVAASCALLARDLFEALGS